MCGTTQVKPLSMIDELLVQGFVVSFVQYFIALKIFSCAASTCALFKIVPIFCCIAMCRSELLIALGLLLSAVGDVALELAGAGDDAKKLVFLFGVAAFLSAHVAYIVALLAMLRRARATSSIATSRGAPIMNIAGAIFFVSFAAVMSFTLLGSESKLAPDDVVMRGSIVIYACVIATMGFVAFRRAVELGCFNGAGGVVGGTLRWATGLASFTAEQESGFIALVGAALFICSDTILSLNKFHSVANGWTHGKDAVMVTYFIAQLFIARSSLK